MAHLLNALHDRSQTTFTLRDSNWRSAEKEDLRLQTRRAVVRLRWLQPIRGRARAEFRPSFRQLGVGSYDVA